MRNNSNIHWTEKTWNPVTGCSKISAGCTYCYAEILSDKFQREGVKKYEHGFEVTLHPYTLDEPYRWIEPQLIFVNSMSDIFHEAVPLEYIQKIFKVMNHCPQHTFQVLTKRADRLLTVQKKLIWTPNIWMGVSVENDKVIERIDKLRESDAKIKFLSCEPLIGPLSDMNLVGIDWVIVGGESGLRPRLVNKEWVLDIKTQCQAAGIPFFFKQWGASINNPDQLDPTMKWGNADYAKGGCLLDGKVYHEMPCQLVHRV